MFLFIYLFIYFCQRLCYVFIYLSIYFFLFLILAVCILLLFYRTSNKVLLSTVRDTFHELLSSIGMHT